MRDFHMRVQQVLCIKRLSTIFALMEEKVWVVNALHVFLQVAPIG